MADEYTTAADVEHLAGTLAVELRTDDGDYAALVDAAVDHAGGRIDFYCSRYAVTELAANSWVHGVATFLAVRWLCQRRLNDVPASVEAEWQEIKAELELVQAGKADVPRAARTRRAATVTNHTVDLRRFNNQTRTDRNRSTGVAKGYRRLDDGNSPDER